MKRLRVLLLLTLCFSLAPRAWADDLLPPFTHLPNNHIYTLAELTDMALTLNPNTRLAWAEVQAAAANLGIARSTYWPQINASVAFQHASPQNSSGESNCGFSNSLYCSNSFTYGPSFTINYLLLDFGARIEQVKNAHYLLLASQFSQNEEIQQVILGVEKAYYQLLGQRALVQADQETLQEAQQNLNTANALHKQGMATIGDVYQAQSQMDQAQLTLQQAQGTQANDQGQLAEAVGLPVETPLKIAKLPNDFATQRAMQSMTQLLTMAKTTRPDLMAASAQVSAAQAQETMTRLQNLPTVELSVNGGQTFPSTGFNNNGLQSNAQISVNIPIFTGFEQQNQTYLAKAQKEQAQAQRDNLSQQIGLQVWQAYYALQTANEAITSSSALLKSSNQAAAQASGQYRAGVGNILTVLSTQATQANARAQFIQARLNWYTALADLSAALGTLTATPHASSSTQKAINYKTAYNLENMT